MTIFSAITLSIMCLIYFGAVAREIIKNGQVYDLLVACCYMVASWYGAYVCFTH